MKSIWLFGLVSLCVLFAQTAHTVNRSSMEEHDIVKNNAEFREVVEQWSDEAIPTGVRAKRADLRPEFDGRFKPHLQAGPAHLSDLELAALYNALHTYMYYTQDPEYGEYLVLLSDEISRRNDAISPGHVEKTLRQLFSARMINQIKDFADKYPEKVGHALNFQLDTLIDENDASDQAPNIIYTQEREDGMIQLERASLELNTGSWFVALIHPGCAFSLEALNYLRKNAYLLDGFDGTAVFVARQDGIIADQSLNPIFADESGIRVGVSYKDEDWPEYIQFFLSPMFYLIRDGRMIEEIMGWRGEETAAHIRELLASADKK
jgi:hypothetical protein